MGAVTFSYNQAIQVLIEANEKSFDDSILLNTSGELCCGSTFIVSLSLIKSFHFFKYFFII